MKKLSRNHWQMPVNHYQRELRRLLAIRYNTATRYVSGIVYEPGCGHGYGSCMLALSPAVSRVIASDTDAEAIAVARKHIDSALQCVDSSVRDVEQSPVPPCDWIVCMEVMEYLDDPESFIVRLKDVAKRGIVLSWPLDRARSATLKHPFKAGELEALMAPWDTVDLLRTERVDDRGVAIEYQELGVFQRPTQPAQR